MRSHRDCSCYDLTSAIIVSQDATQAAARAQVFIPVRSSSNRSAIFLAHSLAKYPLYRLIDASMMMIDILYTHAQYVELYINQLAFSMTQPLNISGRLGFERLECLWQSVENIKSWLDSFGAIHCSELIGQPFHFWSQMIMSLTLLKYLSTLRDPEWDCQAVRNAVPLISTIDSMLQKLDQSSQQPELQCNDHLLHYISKLLTRCRLWAEARWDMTCPMQEVNVLRARNPDVPSHNSQIPDLDQIAWMQSMDLGDDQWFDEVLSIPTTFD